MRQYISKLYLKGIPEKYKAKVRDAIDEVNSTLTSEVFHNELATHEDFDYSKANEGGGVDGAQILNLIGEFDQLIYVNGEKGSYWSKWVGYFKSSQPHTITLNTRRLRRPGYKITATLAHELIHAIDHQCPDYFGHAGNSPKGKQNSAPYWIGSVVAELVKEENPEQEMPDKKLVCSGWWIFRKCRWKKI